LIKRHLFVKEIVDSWIKQDQPIPRMPTTPLQEEAKALCENDDHDWLSDERFNGIAYSSRDDTRQQSETVISVGYTRTCYFCGYTTFVASLYNY